MKEILRLFPPSLAASLREVIANDWSELQEIRIRMYKPIELNFGQKVKFCDHLRVDIGTRDYILNQLSDHSLYRYENELREGYITISGGHRVGLAGRITMADQQMKGLQAITSFNIRIAQELVGLAEEVIHYLHRSCMYYHTLIIGPPQAGKTTLLRDCARIISEGRPTCPSKKVAIIDERSEIAASANGLPQFDIGPRTDVMDNCPKSIGMMMMIRSMSPEVVVIDEIGKEEDVTALLDVIYAGISIICTVHARSLTEVRQRSSLQALFQHRVFQRYIVLSYHEIAGFSYQVYNREFQRMEDPSRGKLS